LPGPVQAVSCQILVTMLACFVYLCRSEEERRGELFDLTGGSCFMDIDPKNSLNLALVIVPAWCGHIGGYRATRIWIGRFRCCSIYHCFSMGSGMFIS
jgi:hypothetical protein